MSCEDCSKAQENPAYVMPIRVGTANLLVLGCRKHCSELLDRLDLLRRILQGYLGGETPPGGIALTAEEKQAIKQRFGL